MISDALSERGIRAILDSRRLLRSRGPRPPSGEVRASGFEGSLAEQITAVVEGGCPAAFVAPDGTIWILDELGSADVVYAGSGEPSTEQAAAIAVLAEILDASAPRPARGRRSPRRSPAEPAEPSLEQAPEPSPEQAAAPSPAEPEIEEMPADE